MPRAGLDAEIVTRRAAAIIDLRGLEGLTLARVAGELGVATPSLYKHVGGLDDLVARVAAAVTADLAAEMGAATRGRSGRDALTAVALVFRRFALAHPGTYPLTQRRLDTEAWSAAAGDAVSAVAAAMSGYGIEEFDVKRVRFVRAALHGFVDLELRGGFGLPDSVDESYSFLIDSLDATLRALDPA
ncbi:AcrR family transcriptional regulator [Okibacterium sp. HSC-33S16]|uniref:TetR/AcrR family transcriptional regulator n=1 Tax=Okibacterium sp. HSC-33S16 TaxID=2910965 RepID=UPI0020A1E8E5|nr:TetR/AcrR family transcriptional regulator [Okibacterium sp. HSC-33S16]MCP2032490.1 AcrR family transcriptional regulator [Okibacterium sp. HSC-33S16]